MLKIYYSVLGGLNMTLLPNKNKLLITFTTVLITTTLLMIVNRNNNYYESSYENQRLLILDSNQLSGNDIQPTINWRGLSQDQVVNILLFIDFLIFFQFW